MEKKKKKKSRVRSTKRRKRNVSLPSPRARLAGVKRDKDKKFFFKRKGREGQYRETITKSSTISIENVRHA